MNGKTRAALAAALALAGAAAASTAQAAYIVYTDQAAFVAATGATSATGPLPGVGGNPTSLTVGSITYSAAPGSSFIFGPLANSWSSLIPGVDVAINAQENFDLISSVSVFAMGFQAHESSIPGGGTDTCGVPSCTDTTFRITIKDGATTLGVEDINFPDNQLAFFGVWSDQLFTSLEIRDLTGAIDDEFFGQVFTAGSPLQLPEPGSLALLGLGLAGLARRRVS